MKPTPPPFRKSKIGSTTELSGTGSLGAIALDSMRQKIRKIGPFELKKVTDEYPLISEVLNRIFQQSIKDLPDFSDDTKIAVMSDYGGEHDGAHFNTYSFLFLAYNKVGPFEEKSAELRKKYGYSEFKYKDLKSGPKARALEEYLRLVDNFIHGAIITIAIDKRIASMFGASKTKTQAAMVKQLQNAGLGIWKGEVAEKLLRVTNIIAAFASLLTHEGHDLLWYSDRDTINENGKKRDFNHTQLILSRVLHMYLPHKLKTIGISRSFDKKSHLDDLLSVPDFAAGVIQDLLQQQSTREDIPGGEEKKKVMLWIATPTRYLSKITIQIFQNSDGSIGFRSVDIIKV
ncbi:MULTISPECIES: hypothetical protein [unclassified Comamonas]|uniref:hypothetical protein n=1 Tax=unclassified Comamonas TaxID=2638500 RepID=UPI001FA7FA20|nr:MULTISPECIES: hypothetical protein [unclassified Comamonas]UNV91859.1 hypothetical protein MP576_05745 [Comamonas sp. 7D-2evo1]UNV94841.1 hypothetical protein MPZ60_20605 [Comamonas sp. 7D-2]UNW01495.1 hypothetical protein MP579_05720 [Comamonas sp. 7D-2evo2]